MAANALFFAWNRSIPGRERESAAHFEEFVGYLTGLQDAGTIDSFDAVFLNPHGGDMNGFFLIRGDHDNLNGVMSSDEWVTHMTRAGLHLEGSGAIRGVTGDLIGARMQLWSGLAPD
jgi:hypothetical protein